ncbi:dTDP-glucose 4,6-dehydratase [Gammaproteobacteria bacterium]|nr:dTDP-glucose 4,6-dehydratase [Gammaproteobacteria bacterium]MDC0090024.1 dTDP-glucose 4,6-dehydratase [Gammaproteobacteria bacterium]
MIKNQDKQNVILVTGGAGFIGSALIRFLINETNNIVVNIDKLTYAGKLDNISCVEGSERYFFHKDDICDFGSMLSIFNYYNPDLIMHLAAESHVDNSIDGPSDFIQTNILGTFNLLEVSRNYIAKNSLFKFHHVSTDEVFGDLAESKEYFSEDTRYAPSSPYSASKASSDHLVRAWARTYGLRTLITNCSNNYGSHQDNEKFIPKVIHSILNNKPIPVYGDGLQIRDWLLVNDHVEALYLCAFSGENNSTYNIGGNNTLTNLDVIQSIYNYIKSKNYPVSDLDALITYVKDRPGHDKRYAVDTSKIMNELGWKPKFSFDDGIKQTINWYLNQ